LHRNLASNNVAEFGMTARAPFFISTEACRGIMMGGTN
jgi:hypothetical protein